MMQRTDRHFRVLMRQFTRETLLYTEMVTSGALLHGDRARHLVFDPVERPLALQLGGSDEKELAECARIAADWGYDEVNLNVGCPSDRVQQGTFGACLMTTPERVADAVAAMRAVVDLPVTVKHRIGVDDLDRYEDMLNFVDIVSRAGADRFSVHARKAWLSGLSPKENRTVPPLRHDDVHRLKRERPHQVVEINGGITTIPQVLEHLEHVDAVMIGRGAYDTPARFGSVDAEVFGVTDAPTTTPRAAVLGMMPYVSRHLAQGGRLHHVSRHMLNLFVGVPGARHWRRSLGGAATRPDASVSALEDALALMERFQV